MTALATDPLSAVFAALSDPTRRAILHRLARGETNVGELARPFNITLPAISKHLKVLERAGLIRRSRRAQERPCELNAEPMKQVADFVEHYRAFWEESFDRLDAYLQQVQADAQTQTQPQSQNVKKKHPSRKERKPS